MAEVDVSPTSWLNLTQLLEFNGVVFWDQTEYPDIPYSGDDNYIQLTGAQADRMDLVAFDQYGDSDFLWILLLANNHDYPNQFIEGDLIRVPSIDTINQLLNTNQSNFI